MTKLLASAILFSIAVNAEVVAKPVILGILPSISVILVLQSNLSPLLSGLFLFTSVNFYFKADLYLSFLVFKTNSLVWMLFTLTTNLL